MYNKSQLSKPQLITLSGRVVYQAECVYDNLSDDPAMLRILLENDLHQLQVMFKNTEFFKERPHALGELHFYPVLMADRIQLRIQDVLTKNPEPLSAYNFRVELVVELNEEMRGDSHVAIAMWKTSVAPDGLITGEIFPPFLTPRYTDHFDNVRNTHKVAKGYSLLFPFVSIPEVKVLLAIVEQQRQYFTRPLFDVEEIIQHYLRWCDDVAQLIIRRQYFGWVERQKLSKVMTEDEVAERWGTIRSTLEKHMRRLADDASKDKNFASTLAVMLHPPDENNLEKDPFLVLEFIEVKADQKIKGNIAKTLELTGRILEPSDFIPPTDYGEYRIVH